MISLDTLRGHLAGGPLTVFALAGIAGLSVGVVAPLLARAEGLRRVPVGRGEAWALIDGPGDPRPESRHRVGYCGRLSLADLRDRRAAGVSRVAIAAEAEVSESAVGAYLERHRLVGRQGGRRAGAGRPVRGAHSPGLIARRARWRRLQDRRAALVAWIDAVPS